MNAIWWLGMVFLFLSFVPGNEVFALVAIILFIMSLLPDLDL